MHLFSDSILALTMSHARSESIPKYKAMVKINCVSEIILFPRKASVATN